MFQLTSLDTGHYFVTCQKYVSSGEGFSKLLINGTLVAMWDSNDHVLFNSSKPTGTRCETTACRLVV